MNPHPKSISIEVTTRCNCSCSHCFARAGKTVFHDLPTELAHTLVAEAFACGYRHLHITGGEPLLWDGLLKVIDQAAAIGYESIFLNTNGIRLNRSTASCLGAYPALALSISLQGPQNDHDSIRGKGRFRQAAAGIENALSAGIRLAVFTTVSRSLMPRIHQFAADIFRSWPRIEGLSLIQLIRVPGDEPDHSGELLEPEDFIALVKLSGLMNRCGCRTDILNNPLAAAAADLLDIRSLPPAVPLQRENHFMVMADGDVTLTHSSRERILAYRPGRIPEAEEAIARARVFSEDGRTCPACWHHRLCRQHGLLRPSEWYRHRNHATPFCRQVLDILFSSR